MIFTPYLTSRDSGADRNELERLVRRSRSGDTEAFNLLASRYYGPTYRLAFRILGGREAAEDAVQEILLKAWGSLPRFRGSSQFTTWLHTIAVRHCLNAARRQILEGKHARPFPSEDDDSAEVPGLPRSESSFDIDRWENRILIQGALEQLPEKLRIVVTLHFFGDYSMGEIAEALGLHPNTVRYRMNKAMGRLKLSLGDPEERR